MKSLLSEYYGDNVRWFVADVIDSTPPFGLEGRVRVRIHGVHSPSTKDIKQSDLPWAQVVLPTTEGGVSGLGRTPRLEAGALVFGFFIDGKASQVPLVLGSIPRVEFPSRVQQRVEFESVLERLKPVDNYYETIINVVTKNLNVQASQTGSVGQDTREHRVGEGVKFFLDRGYTIKQSIAIMGALDFTSTMITYNVSEGQQVPALGIGLWSNQRLRDLKNFSNDWKTFPVQLAFVLYELNTSQTIANSRLVNIDKIDGEEETCQEVFARYYLKVKDTAKIESIKNFAIDLYGKLVG